MRYENSINSETVKSLQIVYYTVPSHRDEAISIVLSLLFGITSDLSVFYALLVGVFFTIRSAFRQLPAKTGQMRRLSE